MECSHGIRVWYFCRECADDCRHEDEDSRDDEARDEDTAAES